ncbi:TRM11 family SAM-dependent methyltransferase [Fodinicola acaciae]|uniref:TRM11 family SAM-dependent methyltransferase n=1 Tax=Fodinicola acaciae TaxID=2681555 RepID=UPI001FEC689B|nr:SAM-dependent methyltransferase [Fodinicola acaciae]
MYAVLIAPSANRVYAEASVSLLTAELGVFASTLLDGRLSAIREERLAGVPYLVFDGTLSDVDIGALANLSSLYALFELHGDLLRPVPATGLDRFSSDLVSIPKYAGKTNEQFTKLLLNVTAVSTDRPADFLSRRLRVLDPMCGRGTTLNQAMTYGFDATGVDLDGKDFEAYAGFLRTWLKTKRLKHTAEITPLRRNRARLGRRFDALVGDRKAGEPQKICFVNADTLRSAEIFKAASFDVLVTDLPYGVQHGSRQSGALSRSPLTLLAEAVSPWSKLVRPGGAVGISWNTYGGSWDEVAEILASAGFCVLSGDAYRGFAHRVDQAINRDLIVATVPT